MTRMLWAAVAAACVLGAAGEAAARTVVLTPSRVQFFRSPDANILCTYAPPLAGQRAFVRCDVLHTKRGPRVAARFTPVGRTRFFRPVDDATTGIRQRSVPEGSTVAVGAFRCTSSEGAMVCMSIRSPYGFALSRERQAPLARALGRPEAVPR